MRPFSVLLLVATLVVCGPLLLHTGLPLGSETVSELVAMRGFMQGFEEGELYPRWVADANRAMGAPLFLFHPPLAYYAAVVVDLFTGEALETFRFTMVLAFVLAGLGFHRLAKGRAPGPIASMGALLYALSPGLTIQIYDRGSLPDLAAWVILPLVLGAVTKHGRSLSRSTAIGACVATAALILAEPVTAFVGLVALGPFVLAQLPEALRRRRLVGLILPYMVALPLAAVYLGPLFLEEGSLWRGRAGGSDPGHDLFAEVAWAHFILTLVAAAMAVLASRSEAAPRTSTVRECWLLLSLSIACFLLQHPASQPLRERIAGFDQMRDLHSLVLYQTLFSILGGILALHLAAGSLDRASWRRTALVAVLCLGAMPALRLSGAAIEFHSFDFDAARAHHPYLHDAILPACLPAAAPPADMLASLPAPPGRAWSLAAGAALEVREWLAHRRTILIVSEVPTQVHFRGFDFPGWEAAVDGQPVPHASGGIYRSLTVDVPAGSHRVSVRFVTSPVRRLGGYLSFLMFLILVSLVIGRQEPVPAREKSQDRCPILLWGAAVAICAWSAGFTTLQGTDLPWQLASGRQILETRSLTLPETWSYAAAAPTWRNLEWLTTVILHLWTRAGGLESLAWWHWCVIISTFLLMFGTMVRYGLEARSAGIALILGLSVGSPFFEIRPHEMSLLFTVILVRSLLLRTGEAPWLPLLFLVWANCHPSAIFGAGLLVSFCALEVVAVAREGRWDDARRVATRHATRALLCLIAMLTNPNGVTILTHPLRYGFDLSSPFRQLIEWLPHGEPAMLASHQFPWLAAVFALAVVWRTMYDRAAMGWKDAGLVILGLVTMVMAFRARRFIPLFGLCQAPLVAMALCALFRRLEPRSRFLRHPFVPALIACVMGIAWLLPYPRSSSAFPYLVNLHKFPVEVMDFVEVNELRGKVFASWGWGGYVDQRTGGKLKVFIDGRASLAFDDETARRFRRVDDALPDAEAIILESGADMVLWPRGDEALFRRLQSTGRWKLLYLDAVSKLLVRSDLPLPPSLSPAPVSGYQRLANALEMIRLGRKPVALEMLVSAVELIPSLAAAELEIATLLLDTSYREAWATLEASQRKFPHRVTRAEFLERMRKSRALPWEDPG